MSTAGAPISVQQPPAIPGLAFRRFRGEADFPGMAALLARSIEMFMALGMEETALGVDTQNPSGALALYESVGYREVHRHTFYRKALE